MNTNYNNYYKEYFDAVITNTGHFEFNNWIIVDNNGLYIKDQSPFDNLDSNKVFNKIINKDFYKKCFYVSHTWDLNIQCQFTELFPKIIIIKDMINNNTNDFYDIFINIKYKDLWFELFDLFDIDINRLKFIFHDIQKDNNIIQYNYKVIYNFGINNIHRKVYDDLLEIFLKELRKNLLIKYNSNNLDNIAILRDKDNKNNTQINRHIANIDNLKDYLKKNNYSIINTENMSLQERFNILYNKKKIIIEAGASIINLFLIDNVNIEIIVLCNENMYNFHGIYEDILKFRINNEKIIIGNMIENIPKNNDYVNYPYYINLDFLS